MEIVRAPTAEFVMGFRDFHAHDFVTFTESTKADSIDFDYALEAL